MSGILGLARVILFVSSLVIFGNLNSRFNFKEDFVSKLGAVGKPNAICWNLTAFAVVFVWTAIALQLSEKRQINSKLEN